MPQCRIFIQRFLEDAIPLLEIQKILKTKGLSHSTANECGDLINSIKSSSVRFGFQCWIDKQLVIAQQLELDEKGLPVSSDPLESLFAMAKHRGVGEVKDANRIASHLPALCGEVTHEDAERVLNITVLEQQTIVDRLSSLTKQRRAVLNVPGSLESLSCDMDGVELLTLLPGANKRSKNENKSTTLDSCVKATDPEKFIASIGNSTAPPEGIHSIA